MDNNPFQRQNLPAQDNTKNTQQDPFVPTQQPAAPAPQQPVQQPATPPVQPEEKKDDEFEIKLDDLFPAGEKKDNQPATPPAPVQPEVKADDIKVDDLSDEGKAIYNSFKTQLDTARQQVQELQQQSTSHVDNTQKIMSRQTELSTFFDSEAGKPFSQFREQISKVATAPEYLNYDLGRVVGFTLRPEALMKLGAKMAQEARKESAASATGGNGNPGQTAPQQKNVWEMNPQEFAEYQNRVRSKPATS